MAEVTSPRGTASDRAVPRGRFRQALTSWIAQQTKASFLLPVVLMLLFLSIFPLLVSAYLSLVRFQFIPGGFKFTFVGLANFRKLAIGIEQEHFLGFMRGPSPAGGLIVGIVVLALTVFVVRALRTGTARQLPGRLIFAAVAAPFVWLLARTLTAGGRPGTLTTTFIYAVVGITVQYWLGLGLGYLTSQNLAGRRLFRVIFLLPMMITPVGIAYTFRIIMDLGKGPFAPVWRALGLAEVSWANDPWGARFVVMLGDIWQWTPFMFIVLLAALESQPIELVEAAMVDGASRWQTFWRVTWPQILPVSSTLILIRLIEAFKIVDLPNVLTSGGPGTATESLSLHAFIAWRTLDIGGSAAVAYSLLFAVTFAAISYVNFIHRRVAESL